MKISLSRSVMVAGALTASMGLLAIAPAAHATTEPTPSHRFTFDDFTVLGNTAADTGSNAGAPGTGYGSPTPSVDVPSAAASNAQSMEFNGSNYIEIPQPAGDSFTICAWIKTTATGNTDNHWESAPILDSELGGWDFDYGFGISPTGNLMYGSGGYDVSDHSSPSDSTIQSTSTVNDNEWHDVCVARDNTTGIATFYLDGVDNGSGQTGVDPVNIKTMVAIGKGYDGSGQYIGLIDDVRVYNTVLTDDEIVVAHDPSAASDSELTSNSDLADTGFNFGLLGVVGSALVAAGALLRIRLRSTK